MSTTDFHGHISEFASDSTPSWPEKPQADPDAPNVIVMLVDDLGFSDLGPYGSEIDTPNIDRLAHSGWTFTNYRTAPMCSPARASLMTGLNPHRAGFGFVAHADPGYPGFTCEIPDNAPTLAESLRAGGYATFMVGKWHLTLESRLHDAAEKSSWPLQRGFESYFGSMDGFTSVHHPHRLVRDNSVMDRREFPAGYFLTDELTDEAVAMIDRLRANDSDKPFFLYYAHTAVHGPIQAKADDIAKFEGRYAAGWNVLRQKRFDRQKELGIIPDHARLPGKALDDSNQIPSWDSLSDEDRALFAKHMEVYAASVNEVDQSVGRLLNHLEELGEAENTIIVLASDNGGSAEAGPQGTRSYFSQFGSLGTLPEDWITDVPRDPDLIGSARVFSQYPTGWARVSNTPYRSFKSSTYEGGVHSPLIVSWPKAPEDLQPGLRHDFVFVSDLAPTLLELTGVEPLAQRQGKTAEAMDGRSRTDVMRNRPHSGRHTQYFECMGRRGLIHDSLKLVSPRPPFKWQGAAGGDWELYNLDSDPTETHDLADERESEVRGLAEQWRAEAWENKVFPLDDNGSLLSTRPSSENSLSRPLTLRPFGTALERFRSSKLTVLRSFDIDISLETTDDVQGAVVAHGDQGGGYLLSFESGRPLISYNAYGHLSRVQATAISTGSHRLCLNFTEVKDLQWTITLAEDGVELARIDAVPMLFGMAPFTGISVGYDYGSPVDWDLFEEYGANWFTGGILDSVTYVPGKRSHHDPTIIADLTKPLENLVD
ncbi:arylsulfatase [Brevibacterium permense]|uniref:arylsulfatase n=1 Tax=Brevibacterium permense TaxID=234834 RepID=UPI0021CF3030|nr:arylsulfatase [Brevibacterium permense]MCU4299042.1 arylsulfatase [Brevibacterium permense]